MTLSRFSRSGLAVFSALVLSFIYTPLLLVVVNSFNTSQTFSWPPDGFTTQWWQAAWESESARSAIWVSVQVAVVATLVALVLGTMAALALQRFRFSLNDHGRAAERRLADAMIFVALTHNELYDEVLERVRRLAIEDDALKPLARVPAGGTAEPLPTG